MFEKNYQYYYKVRLGCAFSLTNDPTWLLVVEPLYAGQTWSSFGAGNALTTTPPVSPGHDEAETGTHTDTRRYETLNHLMVQIHDLTPFAVSAEST